MPWTLATLLFTALPWAVAQATPQDGASLSFTLERTGAAAAHYTVELNEITHTGVYTGTPASAAISAPATGAAAAATGQIPLHVSAEVVRKVFAAAPLVRSGRCESHHKGIAQTGVKTLHLRQNDAEFSCTYNFSDEDRVNNATSVFEALAETMQFGERLAGKLRFDRLGLDAEMDNLQSALNDGRALEVGNIAAVLTAVENDDRVMERVHRKAARILESTGGAQPDAAASASAR